MPLPVPPHVGAENKDQREEGRRRGDSPPLCTGRVKFCHPVSTEVQTQRMSYPRGCVLHTGRVYGACEAWAKVTHSQGWSKDWPFPPPWQPPWERKLLKVRWSGAGEAGRKRKRGDQAKLASRRGFRPLPHRPPGKHKQPEALYGCPESCQVSRCGHCLYSPPPLVRGRVVGPYLGLSQTFQGLHNGLFGP